MGHLLLFAGSARRTGDGPELQIASRKIAKLVGLPRRNVRSDFYPSEQLETRAHATRVVATQNYALNPPSIIRFAPVTYAASGLAK
jgi:hypothetical protein